MIDFALIGVQKAGTTALASYLAELDGISLSKPKEPMLFCCDDYRVHQQEILHPHERWTQLSWEDGMVAELEKYSACFEHREEGDLLGDASTTYAPSVRAAERLVALNPEMRIIMILRDPVERAISSYWHSVRAGIARGSFEDEVRFGRSGLLSFGFYAEQLERYQNLFGKERVLVLHFEDLKREPLSVFDKSVRFLDKEASSLELEAAIKKVGKKNRSYYPRSVFLHLLLSRCRLKLGKELHVTSPLFTGKESVSSSTLGSLYKNLFMQDHYPKQISERTVSLLKELYERENTALPELLGEDVFQKWGWDL